MKFIIKQFYSRSFLYFSSKYLPKHSLIKNLLPRSERPSFATIKYNWKNYISVYFNHSHDKLSRYNAVLRTRWSSF